MKIKLLIMTLLFFVKFGFGQNSVSYSSLNTTITLNSGVEGTSDIIVSCSGSSGTPVVLNIPFLCGDPDGFISYLATNGHSLTPGQTTTLKFKFKKTVVTDTQIVYKFSTNGSCFQDESKMIKVTVNYKAATAPTNPTDPFYNAIYLQYSDQRASLEGKYSFINIIGSTHSLYTYQWEKKTGTGNGIWTEMPGETGYSFKFIPVKGLTFFRRIVRNTAGAYLSTSNEISIYVEPPFTNNKITISGSEVIGTVPNGGDTDAGSWRPDGKYRWLIYTLEGEDPWVFTEEPIEFTVPAAVYDFIGSNNAYIVREIKSNLQYSTSNAVIIKPSQTIENNVIGLSGNNISGTLPTGGTGSFKYEYNAYNEFPDGEIVDGVSTVGNNQNYTGVVRGNFITKYYRKVTSGNKISYSNTITIPALSSFAKSASTSAQTASTDLTAYPNPASESINFSTNFTTDKEIEIVLYSENLGNEKSIFKGKVTPNQVVNWNIPSSYQKGIYFYKIISDHKEVKTGKVIFK